MYPPKMHVPLKDGSAFEFTAHQDMTVEAFKNHVVESSDGVIKNFELLSNKDGDDTDYTKMTMHDLTKDKFRMKVDSKSYDVYPDIRSITGTGRKYIDPEKYGKDLEKLENMQQSVAVSR